MAMLAMFAARCAQLRAARCDACRICSKSDSGKVGSRRISAANRSAGINPARTVSMEAPAPVSEPFTLTRALILSNSSCNCWRVCFWVPRISRAPAMRGAAPLFARLFSSPKCSCRSATTVPPRVFFGSRTSFKPLGSVTRVMRASILAGDGSNASPSSTAALPL